MQLSKFKHIISKEKIEIVHGFIERKSEAFIEAMHDISGMCYWVVYWSDANHMWRKDDLNRFIPID